MLVQYLLSAVNYGLKAMGMLLLSSLFFHHVERREYFVVKLVFGIVLLAALSFTFPVYIILEMDKRINYVFYTIHLLVPYFLIVVCYRVEKISSYICYMAALVFMLAGMRAADLVVYLLTLAGADEVFLGNLAYDAYLIVVIASEFVLLRTFCDELFDFFIRSRLPRRTVLLAVLIALMNLLFGVISPKITMLGDSVYTVLVYLFEIMYCALFFILFMYFVTQVRTEARNIVLENMFVRYEKQYELLKRNIRIINHKSHDLRFRMSGSAQDEEAERAIDGYAAQAGTGNAMLDVIVTDMGYRCTDSAVQFVCSADGRLLSFMSESDMCAMFGNAFENALEYMLTRPEEERFVSVSLKRRADMIHLHMENGFYGSLVIRDGLPETTKSDRDIHGFGMQSIRRVAEKYGGTVHVAVRDDMFLLDILFPYVDSCNKSRSS